ncbi:MAG: DMT family transporter [Candidatus Omnitrophota bacterium]
MWLWLALACAFFVGTGDILSKSALRTSHERSVGLSRVLFTLPILGAVLWARGAVPLASSFWLTLLVMLPFELSAYLLYLRAIRLSPLSLTIPFLALTPVFTILTSWVLLGERISLLGGVGIFAIAAGAYFLHLDTAAKGWLLPLFSLCRERGSRLMMTAAFFYSITSNLGKQAILLSDPYAFIFFYQLLIFFGLLVLTVFGKGSLGGVGKSIRVQWKLYAALGGVLALANLAHCVGIARAPVPYFIAIKRTSLSVGVLYGGMFLKEEKLLQRFVATAVMVTGVALIAIFR